MISAVKYTFFLNVGCCLAWLYRITPFSFKYSLKLASMSGACKRQAAELLKEDWD